MELGDPRQIIQSIQPDTRATIQAKTATTGNGKLINPQPAINVAAIPMEKSILMCVRLENSEKM